MTGSKQNAQPTHLEFRVRYAETDQMGVVYHANYFVWCEMARTELIRHRFMSYAELERRGVILAVADATMRYHAPARYDDLIRAQAWIEEVRSRTVTFGYDIRKMNEDGSSVRLVSATTRLIALGEDSRPCKLPPDLIAALADA